MPTMKLTFNVLRFYFEQSRRQIHKIPTRDIWDFQESVPDLTFYWEGNSNPPFTFSYYDLIEYQTDDDIPSYETVVSDIRAALLASELATAERPYQRFIATAGQTEFTVTDFTPSQYTLVLVDDIPNMSNWSMNANVVIFDAPLPIGAVVIIYQ